MRLGSGFQFRFDECLRQAENECLEWTRSTIGTEKARYGRLRIGDKKMLAHRFAYERAFGQIPAGMFVCHKCDNPRCCNPDHLFLGTAKDNTQDAIKKGRFSGRYSGSHPKGELAPAYKLTSAQIIEIKERRKGGEELKSIAATYGVSHHYISKIARGVRRATA